MEIIVRSRYSEYADNKKINIRRIPYRGNSSIFSYDFMCEPDVVRKCGHGADAKKLKPR